MASGERDHPLRADPLQTLPDAVWVPRRPRPTSPPKSHHSRSNSSESAQPPIPHRTVPHSPSSVAASSNDRRSLERETLSKFQNSTPSDPLQAALFTDAREHQAPTPPAGHAFATDINSFLTSLDPGAHHGSTGVDSASLQIAAPYAAHIVLAPAPPRPGSAAGVYIIRSQRPRLTQEPSSRSPNFATPYPRSNSVSSFPGPTSGHPQVARSASFDEGLETSSVPASSSTSSDASISPSAPEIQVRRTLADFSWLAQRLSARYDGVIVPSLPEMALGGRMAHGYAYDLQRARGLQRFLRQVAQHPVLAVGEEVPAFLGANGETTWQELRRQPVATEPSVADRLFAAERGRDLADLLQRIGVWRDKLLWQSGKRFNHGLVRLLDRDHNESPQTQKADSAQAKLDRLHKYVKDLVASLVAVREASARVSRSRSLEMESTHALQEALKQLAAREGGKFASFLDSIVLEVSHDLSSAGHTRKPKHLDQDTDGVAGNLGAVASDSHTEPPADSVSAIRLLDDVLGDLEERARGAQRIMAARQEEHEVYERALNTYTTLRDKLERKADSMWAPGSSQTNIRKLSNGEGKDELVDRTDAAAARLADVRKHYHVVAVRTTDELRRLRAQLHSELCDGLLRVADHLVYEHLNQAHSWTSVAHSIRNFRTASACSDD